MSPLIAPPIALFLLGAAADAAAQVNARRLIVIPGPLTYEVQQDRGSIAPGAGKQFVGAVFTKPDTDQVRFVADSADLSTESGERLPLSAFCADSIGKDCVPLALLHPGQILGAYGQTGEGYSLVENAGTGLVTIARRGPTGTPFMLIYEAPAAAVQFVFHFGGAVPTTLPLRPKGAG